MQYIAFYLPQYHPIPENDSWWGPGFTDWANVKKARPRFSDHWQPHVPVNGYYDLRDSAAREQQAEIAVTYGIDAFCYYHYWFNGKQLLDQPFSDVLKSGIPKFPFCLCWANENWTRAWDGLDRKILIEQNYSMEDNQQHIEWFLNAFHDARYFKVNGKPILYIYRPSIIPELPQMLKLWRDQAAKAGFSGLYLGAIRSTFENGSDEALLQTGFDTIVEFQPNLSRYPQQRYMDRKIRGLKNRLNHILDEIFPQGHPFIFDASRRISYRKYVNWVKSQDTEVYFKVIPCVAPSWDNSARKRTSTIIQNTQPELFGEWLDWATEIARKKPESEQLVMINAWNEWAEGCHLEPDERMGLAFLEEVRRVKGLEKP